MIHSLIEASIFVINETHREEDDKGGHAPANGHVLGFSEHAPLLDDTCHQGVHVKGLQQHEHEARSEEEVKQDGYEAAETLEKSIEEQLHIAGFVCR